MDWQNIHFTLSSANRMLRSMLMFLGLILVSFGVLIILLPQLLQILVGGTFILIGVAVLGAARRRRLAPRRPIEPNNESDVIDEWR